jgi:predicted cupin superfamily sugar epimerase
MKLIAAGIAVVDNTAAMTEPVEDVVARLELAPHPEGGWFRELYRDDAVTTIHYVLPAGGLSPLHRLRRRTELWHWYGGAPVTLHTLTDGGEAATARLGAGTPLAVVPPGVWQAARAADDGWAWCGCTVAPAFDFADWEMPPRAELLRRWPGLAALVTELTRS